MFCAPCIERLSIKLTIVGCGGVGEALALLVKEHAIVGELRIFNDHDVAGTVLDISHINTRTKVKGYYGLEKRKEALRNTDIIVMIASAKREPGTTRESFFDSNASIVAELVQDMAEVAPNACLCIITNPVNSMVPLASEILRKLGKLDSRKIFGINSVDRMRASTFVGEETGLNPQNVDVPIICGHSGNTIIPVLSQTTPAINLIPSKIKSITKRIIDAGPEVVKAKKDVKCAGLSTAYSAFKFIQSLVDGLTGKPNIVEYAVIQSDVTNAKYFSSAFVLGRNGAERVLELGPLSKFEKEQLEVALPKLQEEIQRGEDYSRSL